MMGKRPLSLGKARGGEGFPALVLMLVLITAYRAWIVSTNGLSLYLDEAQYWFWAQNLDWGYYSKPPVIAAVIAATTAICGDGEFCVRAASLLLYPASTLILFLLARRLFDTGTALLAALLFITLPAVSLSSILISTDVALFFCWTLALYAFVRALDSNAWGDWLLLGMVLGLGMLTKYTMGIFFVSGLVYALLAKRYDLLLNLRAWAAVLLAALVFSPNLWWNWQHGFPTFQHTADIAAGTTTQLLHWDEFVEFLGGQLGVFGILLFPLFLWVVVKGKLPHKALLLSFALPFLVIITLQALFGRANANWAAPSYVAATLLVAAWLSLPTPVGGEGPAKGGTKKRWLFSTALMLNIFLGLLVYHPQPVNYLLNTDVQKRLKGWDEIGQQYLAIQQQYPDAILLAEDRTVLSELLYYARPQGLRGVSWNPQGQLRHHYDLVTTLADKQGRDFLMVVAGELPQDVSPRFESIQQVGMLHVTVHPSWRLDYNVFLLQGFRNGAVAE